MTAKTVDVIVVGLGTAGAAAAMTLARRGVSVLGVDAFRPPHDRASHHGKSRSIRRAYLEGTAYVPMALRAWQLWRKLEADTGADLLAVTGNLTIGPPDAPAVKGFLQSARTYNIAHESLCAAEVRRRWPLLAVPDHFAAGLEIEAGVLFPERCISAMLAEAEKAGAMLRFSEPAVCWQETSAGVRLQTPNGTYEAGHLLLAAGARNKALMGSAGQWLFPKRVPVHWLTAPPAADVSLGAFPVNFWQIPTEAKAAGTGYLEFYTLPSVGPGGRFKAAAHNDLDDCDPDTMPRQVSREESIKTRRFLETYLPSLAQCPMESHLCLYTLTPDGHFILGKPHGYKRVAAAALAGHGFKFAPVLGEILADMLQGQPPAFDTAMFSPGRFGDGGW